ncbi:MAG: hypothetical protein AAFN43_11040, partial [Pseudomonadota bacterium]
SKDNDIVLFADSVAPRHAELDLPSSSIRDLVLTPLEDAVSLDDGGIIDVGQYVDLSSGESFFLGETEIGIHRFGDARAAGKLGLKVFAVVCILAMVPIAYGLVSNLAVGVAGASSNAFSALQSGITDQTARFMGPDPTTERGRLDAFAWTARTKLEDLKLNHRIRVAPTATGSLRASGNVADSELGRWTNFLQWYDSNPGFPTLIRDVNRVDLNDGLPRISSVWLDGKPSVVFSDGAVANVGDQIADGWQVIAIETGAVTLGREGSVISLTY